MAKIKKQSDKKDKYEDMVFNLRLAGDTKVELYDVEADATYIDKPDILIKYTYNQFLDVEYEVLSVSSPYRYFDKTTLEPSNFKGSFIMPDYEAFILYIEEICTNFYYV